MHKGETVPLCRICHVKIEFLKEKRDTLRNLVAGLSKAKRAVSALVKEEFYYTIEEED